MIDLVLQVLSLLAAHPLRSALTALSVASGTGAVLLLSSYAADLPAASELLLYRLGSRELMLWPGRVSTPDGSPGARRVRIRYADLPAIRNACPSVRSLAAGCFPDSGASTIGPDRAWVYTFLYGAEHDLREVMDLRIASGRWFTNAEELEQSDVALLNRPLAQGLFGGDSPLGQYVVYGRKRLLVIGVYDSEKLFQYGLMTPFSVGRALAPDGGASIGFLAFLPLDPSRTQEAERELRAAMGALYAFDPDDARALRFEQNLAFAAGVRRLTGGLRLLLASISAVALLLSAFGAATIVKVSVRERTSEIGLCMAVGATRERVRAEVLLEVAILCFAGAGAGCLAGALVVRALGPLELTSGVFLTPALPTHWALGVALGLSILSTAAAWPAASRAAALDPMVALRTG